MPLTGDSGAIEITLEEVHKPVNTTDKNTYQFVYKDNGKGLPANFKASMTKTLGFRLIHMLAKEMDGTINVLGNDGVKVSVIFSEK